MKCICNVCKKVIYPGETIVYTPSNEEVHSGCRNALPAVSKGCRTCDYDNYTGIAYSYQCAKCCKKRRTEKIWEIKN